MLLAAMWFQESDMATVAANTHWIMIFTGLVALAMVVQGIAILALALKAIAAMKDGLAFFDSIKVKVLPVIQSSSETIASVQAVIKDATPKIKVVTENIQTISANLVDTSNMVKSTAQNLKQTATDANQRTQRQVVRVDGMVTAALTTTAELGETIANGIRVPAHKIAVMATQARITLEDLFDKAKSMTGFAPKAPRTPTTPITPNYPRHPPQPR